MAINALDPNVRFAKRRVRLSLLYKNYEYVAEQTVGGNVRGIDILAAAAESWAENLDGDEELVFKNLDGDELVMTVGDTEPKEFLKMIVSAEIVDVTPEDD